MEKRLFIAILISFVFLLGWSKLAPTFFPELARQQQVKEAEAAKKTTPAAAATTESAGAAVAPAAAQASPVAATAAVVESRVIETVIDRPGFTAVLTNRGAQLTSFKLKDYKAKHGKSGELVELVKSRPADRSDFPFALVSADPAWNDDINARLFRVERQPGRSGEEKVVFTATDRAGRTVRKIFTFGSDFQFGFRSELSDPAFKYRTEIGPGIQPTDPNTEDSQFNVTGNGLAQIEGSIEQHVREDAAPFLPLAEVDFVGLEDNYFLTVLSPEHSDGAVLRSVKFPAAAKDGKPRQELYSGVNAAGGVIDAKAYFGPKQTETLDKYGLSNAVHFGFFGPIALLLLKALVYVYGFTKNYGWAIVVLTVIIKLLLYPLQHKSIVSMKKMQKVQPKMNAIKEKYRKAKTDPDQRQKMNTEMMALYGKEGISPVSGCLPILLQLPILWAFYSLLSNAIELRGAPFIGWIADLSDKDPYYITPILMTATMFIQQWITPSTIDPVQKKVFMAMPLIFGFIFKEFPSGLVLYWLVQNILTIAQQMIMNKYWNDHPESLESKPDTKAKRLEAKLESSPKKR